MNSFDNTLPIPQSCTTEVDISPKEIITEIEATIRKFKPVEHKRVLTQLLLKISRLDFRELAELDDEERKLQKKHYLVCCVEELLSLARAQNWGLCKKYDFVYLYNGAYWSLLPDDELKSFLGKAAEKMGVNKFDCRHYIFRDQLYKQFLSIAYLPEPESEVNLALINLQNGTFEVTPQGGRLRDFCRDDFLTYQLPFEYNQEAKAPLFQKYLNRVLPDQELQQILSEYLAYIFTRHLKLEKTLILFGTGANGKSVFFEIVNALLGKENVTSYSLQSLTNESGYQRAKLANSLVNYASEINGKLETAIFKQLVSGEPVEARLPYGDPFIVDHYARLIFNCNELPKEVEYTPAYFRRFLIVPFEVTIPEEEQDKELANKIICDELSGVFNWVQQGLERLLKQKGFTESRAVRYQLEQYRRESDSVQSFLIEEGYIISTSSFIPMKILYQDYRPYSLENGFRTVSSRTFSQRLKNLGYTVERRNFGNVVYAEKINSF